jgi:hypothetical protein
VQAGPLNLQFEQEFEVGVDEVGVGGVLHCAATVVWGAGAEGAPHRAALRRTPTPHASPPPLPHPPFSLPSLLNLPAPPHPPSQQQMSWDDLSKNEMVWPSVREVNAYRRQVYELVRSHILTHPSLDDLPVSWVSRGAWVAARGQPAAATFKPGAACQPASQLVAHAA